MSAPSALNTYRWRKLREHKIATSNGLCAECGRPIDRHARARSTWSPSVDHVVPRSRGGDMWNPANLRVVHYGCNSRKRDRPGRGTVRSQPW